MNITIALGALLIGIIIGKRVSRPEITGRMVEGGQIVPHGEQLGMRDEIKNLPSWQLRSPDGSRDEPMISRREVLEILYPIQEID